MLIVTAITQAQDLTVRNSSVHVVGYRSIMTSLSRCTKRSGENDMQIYISFGQVHAHRVNNKTFDCNTLAEISCESHKHGRELAFEYFGDKFFSSYTEAEIADPEFMKWFPHGILKAN